MIRLVLTVLVISSIILLVLGIKNVYQVKLSINSIKNKKSYFFVVMNIFIAVGFIFSFALYLLFAYLELYEQSFLLAGLIFLLSSLFMFVSSILTKEMGGLLYKLDSLIRLDSLTGIYNHGYIEKSMRREFKRSKRYNRLACLVIIDINSFKMINDTFGHQAGDKVLLLLSKTLLDLRRENDLVGRYGGDEFIIILPETDAIRGHYFIERLKRELNKRCIEEFGNQLSFSISAGVSDIQEQHANYSQWLHSADLNLYEIKKQHKANVD